MIHCVEILPLRKVLDIGSVQRIGDVLISEKGGVQS